MINPMAMTIEGRRDSVKRKGKPDAVGVKYDKYKIEFLRLWKQANLPHDFAFFIFGIAC
jgi:hypothetical protein